MPYNAGYNDRILTCRECGQTFTFTAGEQEFYASRGLTNDPSRCPDCRAARRNAQGGGFRQPRAESGQRYETTCADCGRVTSVPFVPREDRPVYCSDCYQNHRPARAGHSDSSRGSYGNSGGYSSGGYGGGRGRGNDRGGGGGRRDRDYDRW
jgi:CxxC-x17-CxxC domain-containing protein